MKIPKSFTFISSLLIILFWSSLANEGLFALSEKLYTDNGVNHALIIGIGGYDKWAKLSSPPKDASEVARILTEKYNFKKENIVLLTDTTKEKPTLVTIVTYLDKYVSTLTEKDNLLIFYSGHSTEDEDGNTYWIPKNAQKKLKMTWLSHSGICEEYLASDKFKAKNVAIVTDSLFSKKLLKPTSIVLSPYDLRYPEKITEKATKKSREVIAFGDKHWPGGKKTEGFGLFTYYFRKALIDNWFKVIDLENLIFNEDIILQVRKVAGTRLLRGRLRNSPMEDDGQTIIARVISPPPVNITDTYVNPKKGFVGDKFIIEAITNRPAFEVYVELKGKKYLMDGEGTEWRHSIKVASLGTSPFKILAINEDDLEGKTKKGELTTIKSLASMVNVTNASVSPKRGLGGDEFSFAAKTDRPAQKVTVIIEGKRYEMTGSGTDWSLKRKVEESGAVAFSIAAINKDGLEGRSRGGILSIKAPQVDIVTLKAAPDKGYAGDEFLITANTNHLARSVTLELAGVTYEMQGSGREWSLKRKIPDIGKKKFTVIAKNTEGKTGLSKSGEIMTRERPAGIPDVTTVALNPKKVYAGENFVIRVKTSAAAEAVFVELSGKKQPMEGSGTEWKYATKIASVGDTGYKVTARNKDGKEGRPSEGKITTTEKAKKGIDVIKVAVNPKKGNQGQTFTFEATTSAPAKSVAAVVGEKKYSMTGSGTNWSLKKKIDGLGSIDFYFIATDKKGDEGSSKGGSFVTKALLANVVEAKVTADKGYAGEEFTVTVNTDNPASAVSLEMGGVTYDMEGSGKKWLFKQKIHDVGKKTFTVTAKNIEDVKGRSKGGEVVARLAIPDVTTVSFSPTDIFAGDTFVVKAKTNVTADQVFVVIDGKRHAMGGAGTEWSFPTQVDRIGTSKYKLIAKNKEGKEGLAKEGNIAIAKKPEALVNVAKAEVSPVTGYAGGTFTFKANTDRSARAVTLNIGGKGYPMKGSGTDWTLTQKIDKTGSLVLSMVAVNDDKVEGVAKTATFTVQEIKQRYSYNKDGTITDKVTGDVKKRFKNNGDGTITDLATNLMWLQQPKTIAVSHENAEDYCRELALKNYTGWRLPTASEWKSIIDRSQKAPSLPLGHPFKNIVYSVFFWSKTKHKRFANRIYVADLYTGKIGAQSIKNDYIAWPVRYAEAK
ncbi:DUF1566 domain-containing protein [Thermodesulfobacteriota bacterium]